MVANHEDHRLASPADLYVAGSRLHARPGYQLIWSGRPSS
jgi:hypothetical protein